MYKKTAIPAIPAISVICLNGEVAVDNKGKATCWQNNSKVFIAQTM